MSDGGYIKLHRKLLDWEWYQDIPTKTLFIHLLLKANWISKTYKGMYIMNGEIVTSIRELALETGLSEQQIRTALSKLKSTHEITSRATNKNTLIMIEKWELYQCQEERINEAVNRVNNNQITNKYQPYFII